MKKTLVLVLLLVWAMSCEAAKPKYSQSDVSSATTREQQIALYSALETELAATRNKSTKAAYQELINELGNTLGTDTASQIKASVESSRLPSGQVPLDVLNQAEKDADSIRFWRPDLYPQLIAELRQDRAVTDSVLIENNELLGNLNQQRDMIPYLETLRQIRDLFGDNETVSVAYDEALKTAQESLISFADKAQRNDNFSAAIASYETLRKITPDYPGIDQLIESCRTGKESSGFLQLLLEGDIDGAYAAFTRLSNQQLTAAEKEKFIRPAVSLADYMSSSVGQLVEAGQYAQAYAMIKREGEIRNWLNEPSQVDLAVIRQFTEAMFDLSVASGARDYFGLEYGYLLLVAEFDPGYSTLDKRLPEAEQAVYQGAIRRVEPVMIKSVDPSDQNMAFQIAAGVREYLMANIPDDVKIVEREKLDEIIRERGMNEEFGKNNANVNEFESADYLIKGELLMANVVTAVKTIKNTERVVTGEEAISNPAFEAWIKEKGKRKADHPDAPPKTIMRPVTEDLALNIEEHQKDGEVSVTYRVIDSLSAEHIHSNSISKSVRVTDQAREGIHLGSFVQEPKLAELPSDREIYNTLADEVVVAMSQDLVSFLVNPAGDYFQHCQQLANEFKYHEAAEDCAKGAVLRQFKSQPNAEVVDLLKTVTLGSGMRTD